METIFFPALVEGGFATLEDVGREALDFWQINSALLLREYMALAIFNIQYTNPFCVAEYRDIGVVGGKNELTRQLSITQFSDYALGGMLHAEVMPVPRTDISSLDDARLLNYLRDILRDPEIPSSAAAWQARLLGLGFLAEAGENICCTIAGLVLFGKSPRRYLKQAGLRVFAFEDVDKAYKAELDEILDGPLVGRWDVTESGKDLVDSGLIERFVDAIGPFISQEAGEVDTDFRREAEWFYPIEAVRETVINALTHRDWTRFVEVEVGSYADRLEVVSPGALPNSMSVEKMIAGQRSPRNPLITEVLRDYGYVDYRGMGVRTKIVPLTRAHTGREPDFVATEDHLNTTLYRKSPEGNP